MLAEVSVDIAVFLHVTPCSLIVINVSCVNGQISGGRVWQICLYCLYQTVEHQMPADGRAATDKWLMFIRDACDVLVF
jgi:hypothetical protein